MPAISVILPVKNEEKYIKETLQSVVEQRLKDIEIIVINDGSTDNTGEIIRVFKSDERVRIIELTESRGIVTALNTGLRAATGEYIARMDGDDIMYPDRLQKQLRFMESNPDVDLCGCRVRCISDAETLSAGVHNFQKWHNSLLTGDDMRQNIYVDSPMVHPTFFGPRTFFEKMGGYRDTGFAEDYDLILRAIFSGSKLAKLPETLLDWRDHPLRETRSNPNLKKDRLFRQKAHFFSKFDPLAKRPLYLFGPGRFGKALLDALAGEGLAPEGVIDPSGKRLASGVRGLPAFSLDAKLQENTVIINALSMSAMTTPAVHTFLADKTVLNWVL